MARKALTEDEVAARVAGCMRDIGDEWRAFVEKIEGFSRCFRAEVGREDWESAKVTFSLFKTYMRKRTTESVRLSDKLLSLQKELKTTRETQGAK